MTCRECRWFKCCFERSRNYPCRSFKIDDRTPTERNKKGVNKSKANYLMKNTTPENGVTGVMIIMKATPTPTKSQIERVAQEVQELAAKTVQDNSAMFLIALARRFGFREKRLNEVIDEFNSVENEYQKYSDDEIFDDKICEELKYIGIEPDRIYCQIDGVKMQLQKSKKRKESKQLTLKEQYEMKKIIEEMRKCL